MDEGGSSESPKKAKSKASPKPMETLLKQKFPADFFTENENIAGFDNISIIRRKSLYTTVRKLVENSLDSAKSISELLVVEITIKRIGKSIFNSMIGLVDREHVDAALYDGFETKKARELEFSNLSLWPEKASNKQVPILSLICGDHLSLWI
ncbi:hypothetical protein RJT34_07895 [Clitoria ternatea]|uniref:Uncharacterized protein n=1 Tax=Clitoria ternatea TaxID=43366 RepID=A0AAN9K6C9_CLITE